MDEDLPGPKRSPAFQEALRRLGNPYASIDGIEAPTEFRPLTAAERAYVRKLENQYASLSIGIPDDKTAAPASRARPISVPEISKVGFEKECRRIFQQYIPALEKGRIRPHHRDFISRNAHRVPGVRYALLEKLRRYDLRDLQGLQAQFNRERDPFTEAKLREVEISVLGAKKRSE